MRTIKFFFCTLFLFCFFSTCQTSNDTASEKFLFGEFYIRYLATDNMIQAEAKFKEGLTIENAIGLKFEKNVFFQDGAMTFENLERQKMNIQRYNTRRKKPFVEKYTFKYQDNQGKAHEQIVSMSPITNYTLKDALNKSGVNTLSWEGDPLSANESLVLIIHDVDNKAISIKINGPSSGSVVKIPKKKIATLAVGSGGLDLMKKQLSKASDDQSSIITNIEYYAKGIAIEIVD